MTQLEKDPLPLLERRCQAAVDRMINNHRCQILSRAEFIRRTLEHLRQIDLDDPYRAATGVYSLALYAACSGSEGAEQQERGYSELYAYLHNIAVWHDPHSHDDVTQSAIVQIFERFARCQHPVAFLAFAIQQLLSQVKKLRRHHRRQGVSLDHAFTLNPPPDPKQHDPLDLAIAEELRLRVQHEFEDFRRAYPKAAKQIDALALKYLQGMDDQAISQALGCSVKSVQERRARACQKLREDRRWQTLAVAFGLAPQD